MTEYGNTPPGLIKREIIGQSDETVTFRETWDLTTPGCPLIALKLYPLGPSDAISCERTVTEYRTSTFGEKAESK